MKKSMLGTLTLAAAAAGLLLSTPAQADDYPNKPIRIVVPFATGGGTSNAARLIGEKLTERWGQPVVIDNRPGGNTVIGAENVAKSPADGYTLFFANSSFAINPGLMPKLPYDSARDFTPVASLLVNNFVMLAHPSVPARNLAELIKLIKAKPDDYPYPTVGAAGIGRLASEMFNTRIGAHPVNIPYKGTSQLATDLMGGQVKYAIEIPAVYIPQVKAGKVRALAVTGTQRLASLPDVPTFAEAGMPDFNMQSWYGLLAPAGTPRPIIDKLSTAIQEILKTSDVQKRFEAIEAEPLMGGPAEFGALIKKDTERFARIIKEAKIEAP
ncbi:tripartite tricarboxylate transporter substrate binding protein [Hydrogenophaga sp.]|uniref:tripartite tricarboxylate transporter substrate binding protein n=1 Tax=Hydrogenophaga sp. TaxID=1904254 RepID=UPI00271FC422|nr:tripartite tricarboxylate transporter substrate binding protein [Hydrogenophaga sp.]MDO9434950.1 tripartite tricarboxylate transporter substrate binding protein [Hydrogenophaga sp.]